MSTVQKIVLALSVVFFCVLYFGFSVKPKKIAAIESNRAETAATVDINNLIRDVQDDLTSQQRSLLIAIEKELQDIEVESNRIDLLKRLSGKWFEYGYPHIAGFYAEKVAEIVNDETAWSITGTTFAATFEQDAEDKVKDYALERATAAFENAISLAPDAIQPRVNLALSYVERPPQENPMKGILMLIELNKNYPDNPMILTNLGRLAIQTGQFDRAAERLSRVLEIDPENRTANCLMYQLLTKTDDLERAKSFGQKCGVES